MTAEPSASSPPGVGDPGGDGTAQAPAGLGPHTAVLLVSGFVSVVLAAVTMLLPVPYAELRPGPALNTLGSPGGKPLISVTGHETYPIFHNEEVLHVIANAVRWSAPVKGPKRDFGNRKPLEDVTPSE